jgi:hypothetical protein
MELLNFLSNYKNFEDIKSSLTNEYNLNVKDDGDLYIIYYNHNQKLEHKWMYQCRGIILEKNTNKIVCYTFNRNAENINELSDKYTVEKSIDGSQIRLFYYNNKWNYATTRCINANKAYWFSDKSFYELFLEASSKLDYDKLNKDNCYSFVLCHPDNRIGVKYDEPKIYHVLTRNLTSLEELDEDIGIEKPEKYNLTYDELLDMVKTNDYNFEGYIIKDINNKRLKLENNMYNMVRELRGNCNNLFYRYIELRRDGMVDTFLEYFPEYKQHILTYQRDLIKLFNYIYQIYVAKNITHELDYNNTPQQFKMILYTLHGLYLQSSKKISFMTVVDEMNKLDPKIVCDIYNKTYGKHYRENIFLDC